MNIFVGNLPYDANETDLRRTFERYGRVASVRIMSDRGTSRSRGFAFVQMPSLDDADEAIQSMSGTAWHGRQLTVNASKETRDDKSRHTERRLERSRALELFQALQSE